MASAVVVSGLVRMNLAPFKRVWIAPIETAFLSVMSDLTSVRLATLSLNTAIVALSSRSFI